MKTEHISQYSEARNRLKRNDRYHWRSDGRTAETDRLVVFTVESHAREESTENFRYFQSLGQRHGADFMVANDMKIQFVSERRLDDIRYEIENSEWYRDLYRLDEHWRRPTIETDTTDRGECVTIRTYRHNFLISDDMGAHDLASEKRVKNREQIIRTFWDFGFATWRGRPPTVARIRWSGSREELEELTDLYHRHSTRSYVSDMAKKITSAYRSINRYAAWPGSW